MSGRRRPHFPGPVGPTRSLAIDVFCLFLLRQAQITGLFERVANISALSAAELGLKRFRRPWAEVVPVSYIAGRVPRPACCPGRDSDRRNETRECVRESTTKRHPSAFRVEAIDRTSTRAHESPQPVSRWTGTTRARRGQRLANRGTQCLPWTSDEMTPSTAV